MSEFGQVVWALSHILWVILDGKYVGLWTLLYTVFIVKKLMKMVGIGVKIFDRTAKGTSLESWQKWGKKNEFARKPTLEAWKKWHILFSENIIKISVLF